MLLRGVITSGTGGAAGIGRPAAGKTGTHEGHQQSWFVGFTPQLATAVYVGTPTKAREMDKITIGGRYYSNVFGGTIAAPLWGTIMRSLVAPMPVVSFNPPSATVLYGDRVSVPNVYGRSVGEATAILRDAGFEVTIVGNYASGLPAGAVISTVPAGTAAKGTTIGLQLSTGVPPVAPKPPPPATKPSTTTPSTSPSTTPKPSSSTTKP